jgi:hypothetical protein
MLRLSLFAFAVLLAGMVNAQVTAAPDAAAPVVYSDAPANAPGCDSDVRNADGSPVISCVADEQPQDEYADADTGEYAQEYAYDDAPVYDTAPYYVPNFYLGVSALPYDYWAFGFGWPYYAYATFGYGWPYFGFASYWGGRHWGGHHGWHGHDGWHDHHGHGGGFHGPYRYVGHGRYWDQTHASNSRRSDYANHQNMAVVNRSTAGNPATAMGNRSLAAPVNAARFAPSANNRVMGNAGQRAVLPSAAQSRLRTTGASVPRSVAMSRNSNVSAHAANPHWVASLPSRNYAAYARANSVYRNNSGGAARSYAPRNGYAMAPRATYSPPQRYAMPSRAYSTPHSAPSYSHGGGGYAVRSGSAPSTHSSSGGSHAGSSSFRVHR